MTEGRLPPYASGVSAPDRPSPF